MIQIKNVSKHFGGIKAVENVSLNINEGSITGLIGPNGAGKTTLFNIIAGFYSPDFGEIIFKGENISCLLYTSPSPRDATLSRMPSSA